MAGRCTQVVGPAGETTTRQQIRLSALGELDGGATSVVRPMVSMNRNRNVRYPEPGTRKPGINCSNPLLAMPVHDGPGGRAARPTWVRRVCLLPICLRGGTWARQCCSGIGVQLGAGQPPVAAIATGSHDSLRRGPDTVNHEVAGQRQSRQGTTSPCGWLHVPCNAWATAGRSTPSNPFDSLGWLQKCP